MASFQLSLDEQAPFSAKMLNDMPEMVRFTLKAGFSALARVRPDRHAELMAALREAITTRTLRGESEQIRSLVASPSDVGPLLSTGTFIIAALQTRKDAEAVGQFIQACRDSGIIAVDDSPNVLTFMNSVVMERAAVSETVERADLAAAVLPAITKIGVAIDVRLRFDKDDRIARTVAVAVLHIDTDTNSEMWLQASTAQLEAVVEKLATAIRRLKAADEKLAVLAEG